MRVLHLATTGWNEREGVARAVQAIAARLPAQHHLCATGARGAVFDAVHDLQGGVAPVPWSKRLREVLAAVRPDVIHVHGGEGVVAAAVALPREGVPVVVSVYGRLALPSARHPSSWRDHRRADMTLHRRLVAHGLGLPLLRVALRRGEIAAVCSPDPTVIAALTGAGPVFHAQGAAEPSARRATWAPDPTIVFAGRAESGRGIDELVLAHLRIRRVRPEVRLLLALLPSPELGRWAGLRHPGVQVLTGRANDLDEVLAGAQVAALPFRMDATITPALVAAEAMAVGLPVVGTPVSCLGSLVREGHNGRLVPARAPDALAGALLDVLADQDTWSELSDGARRTIEAEWHWDNAAAAVHHAYHVAVTRTTAAA